MLKDGGTEGEPTNEIVVNESVLYYKRERKNVGFKTALPFRFRFMMKLCNYARYMEEESLLALYVMGTTSV